MTNTPAHRLQALRAQLRAQHLDGFIVPLTDEHMSEYVGAYARRLAWLTGFAGSAGSAVVLADQAAIFVDGRYTLQVREQADASLYSFHTVPDESPIDWLAANSAAGQTIGFDPWLTTQEFVATASVKLAATLVPVAANPIDAIWADRPAPGTAPVEPFADHYAGQSSADKRRMVAEQLRKLGAGHAVITALDSVAWLLNIRGGDVHRTPVVRAFAIIADNGAATLFTNPARITPEIAAHLGADVTVQPYADFAAALGGLSGKVLLDPAYAVAAVHQALAGATIIAGRDPTRLSRAIKNKVELDGIRAAHVRDGLAVTRFLHKMAVQPAPDEATAEQWIEDFRRQSPLLRDLSFDSISAFGGHAASPHYKCTPQTNAPIRHGIYLIDSGGQYPDGTTDITRTIAIGTPTAEMRDRFTRVLKGHIALATARFPEGTSGGALDTLARQYLWQAGLDYAHGTGHGVGHYLSVHEGPQRIGKGHAAGAAEPLRAGMFLSNEPGYYKTSAYGIRIENLVIVIADPQPGDEQPMLAFETVTLAPIDRALIDPALLSADEIRWLDTYHARVAAAHAPHLDEAARGWLRAATTPLNSPQTTGTPG